MTFEQKFAEFLQSNPALAVPDDAKVVLTIKQLKQVANNFWRSGRDTVSHPDNTPLSLFEMIFGTQRSN